LAGKKQAERNLLCGQPKRYIIGTVVESVKLDHRCQATISGNIPRVEYRNKTLSLGGELIIKVFDGDIKITKLASSGLFTDFPNFSVRWKSTIWIWDQLTGKFKFGGLPASYRDLSAVDYETTGNPSLFMRGWNAG